jgi:pimeloyl-ACP methyl ester carboxylesterase
MSRSPLPAALAVLAAIGAMLVPGTATAADGPPLRVPEAQLAKALRCSPGIADAKRDPVLLVPGTTLDPAEFSWNYVPAFRAQGIPYCTVELPDHGMADIQTASEYVTHAIRTVSGESGHKVDLVGHSQGGMIGRWSLKYWPDTRGMVGDVVGLAPSNHGTLDANLICVATCAPSLWQQRQESAFMRALNNGPETWAGIDYTNVYPSVDEVVVPNFDDRGSSSLHTGAGRITNVGVGEKCPLHVADHITTGTSDPVSFALAMDAITHDGPANPARVDRAVCGQLLMPYIDPVAFPANVAGMTTTIATQLGLYPHTPFEPAPAPYTR